MSIVFETRNAIAIARLSRPEKRNAVNDAMIRDLEEFFRNLPAGIKAAVICGAGEHFSAGLDLSEVTDMSVAEGIHHSRRWHRAFEAIAFGTVPVVAVLHGAVLGGGLELAAATHVRVAEATTFYALPEAQRGIFVGGGGSVRLPRLMGTSRMMEMMLTGRVLGAEEGAAVGLSHYVVPAGQGFDKAMELAERMAGNAPLTNFALIHALPRIAEAAPAQGFLIEALMSAVAQGDEAAKERVRDFLEKRAQRVTKG